MLLVETPKRSGWSASVDQTGWRGTRYAVSIQSKPQYYKGSVVPMGAENSKFVKGGMCLAAHPPLPSSEFNHLKIDWFPEIGYRLLVV
jgi:hypothetical protein